MRAGGDGRVIDTRTGKVLASYTFTTAPSTFVNDVILGKDAAWFTDSRQPVLYKVPLVATADCPARASRPSRSAATTCTTPST